MELWCMAVSIFTCDTIPVGICGQWRDCFATPRTTYHRTLDISIPTCAGYLRVHSCHATEIDNSKHFIRQLPFGNAQLYRTHLKRHHIHSTMPSTSCQIEMQFPAVSLWQHPTLPQTPQMPAHSLNCHWLKRYCWMRGRHIIHVLSLRGSTYPGLSFLCVCLRCARGSAPRRPWNQQPGLESTELLIYSD